MIVVNNNPKVSIIIPVYNTMYDNLLERCFDSIINQTYDNIEIIFVDDCSTDNSYEFLYDKAKMFFNKIKLYKTHRNVKIGGARNVGIKNATGKYIVFLDSDDYFDSNYIKTMVSIAERNNSDCVYCQYNIVDNKGNIRFDENRYKKIIQINSNIKEFFLNRKIGYLLVGTLFLLKTIHDNNLHFYEDMFLEDFAVGGHWLSVFNSRDYTELPLYNYYLNQKSSINSVNISLVCNYLAAANLHCQLIKNDNLYHMYKDEMDYYELKFFESGVIIYRLFENNFSFKETYKFLLEIIKSRKTRYYEIINTKYYNSDFNCIKKLIIATAYNFPLIYSLFLIVIRPIWSLVKKIISYGINSISNI